MLDWNMTLADFRNSLKTDPNMRSLIKQTRIVLVKQEETNHFDFLMVCILGGLGKEKIETYMQLIELKRITTISANAARAFSDRKNSLNQTVKEMIMEIDADRSLSYLRGLIESDYFSYDADGNRQSLNDKPKVLDIFNRIVGSHGHSIPGRTPMDHEQRLADLIRNGVTQVVLTGAPGTGKTRMAMAVANELGGLLEEESEGRYRFVQFHPSYDYTDFVEGLRPVEIDGSMQFVKMDGIFKAFCRQVAEKVQDESYRDHKFFFIIDEINRADLSKVFGELMFGLESDKRGAKFDTQYANLPTYMKCEDGMYRILESDIFKDGFYIPKNVVILGTMNDIDRSVESMDFALRRRFTWLEVDVSRESLRGAFLFDDFFPFDSERQRDVAERLAAIVDDFNRKWIEGEGRRFGLNRHYFISQGHFANLGESHFAEEAETEELVRDILEYVWKYRLKSLLNEYVRGENDAAAFVAKCEAALLGQIESGSDSSSGLAAGTAG